VLDPKASRPSRLQTPCSPHHRSSGGDLWLRAPLLRFVRPFNASGWLRPLSRQRAGSNRGFACRFVPSSSFLRPRRFAPQSIPVRVSPHNVPGVRFTLQGLPASRGPLRYRRDLPLLNLMVGSASAVTSASTCHRSFRGLLVEATVVAHIRFPSCEDSSPSWASLCGTSLRPLVSLPEGGSICDRSFGPVTCSEL
jgi:hypothetical protein